MARTLTKDEIDALPTEERLDLIAALWDSLSPADVPLPESHRIALEAALQEHAADPKRTERWDDVLDSVFRKR